MNLKTKSWVYGISAVLIVVALNLIILSLLGFPAMATEIIKKYFILLVLLIGGFGLQVGMFTYFKNTQAITCTTTYASGGISGISMILCCSHYVLNILPFLGAIIGMSAFAALTKYTPHFLVFGILSNIAGIGIMYYQKNQYSGKRHGGKNKRKKNELSWYVFASLFIILLVVFLLSLFSIFPGKKAMDSSLIERDSAPERNPELDKYRSSEIPEECRLPEDQNDPIKWREHLSHHESTWHCLDYYEDLNGGSK